MKMSGWTTQGTWIVLWYEKLFVFMFHTINISSLIFFLSSNKLVDPMFKKKIFLKSIVFIALRMQCGHTKRVQSKCQVKGSVKCLNIEELLCSMGIVLI